MTKKLILLSSVGVACFACWVLVITCTWLDALDSVFTTILSVAITASMDPTWKISHLYSVELFPTPVRNMARGLCTVFGRLGSMAGPLVSLLSKANIFVLDYSFSLIQPANTVLAFCDFIKCSMDSFVCVYARNKCEWIATRNAF